MITNKIEKNKYCIDNHNTVITIVMNEDFEEVRWCNLKFFEWKEYDLEIGKLDWTTDAHKWWDLAISFFLTDTEENKKNTEYTWPGHMAFHEVQVKMFTDRFDIID